MKTEFLDILYSDIHVAYKCVARQKISKVPEITELERVWYKQKNPSLCKKTMKLVYFDYVFAFSIYYKLLKTRNIYKI